LAEIFASHGTPLISTTPVANLAANINTHCASNVSSNFLKKFKTALMGYQGAWGKLIHEKNLKSKISWHYLFKPYSEKCFHEIAAKLLTHSSVAEKKFGPVVW
jgi:hypothetical protein